MLSLNQVVTVTRFYSSLESLLIASETPGNFSLLMGENKLMDVINYEDYEEDMTMLVSKMNGVDEEEACKLNSRVYRLVKDLQDG